MQEVKEIAKPRFESWPGVEYKVQTLGRWNPDPEMFLASGAYVRQQTPLA